MKKKVEYRTVVLNGSKVWWGFIGAILLHGAGFVWWASGVNNTLSTVKNDVQQIKRDIYHVQPIQSQERNNHSYL